MKTQIYLIRHAEAEGNIYRRLDGQYNSNITANGLRQIEALKKRFETVPIDAVYASDLYRTRKTAEAICLPKGLPLIPEPRFREVSVGPWEDLPFGELERTQPEALHAFLRDPEHWLVEGAESYAQYSGRFAEALREAAEAHPGGSVAIFTHGCVLSGGLHRLLGIPHDSSRSDNAAVCLLEYEDGGFKPVYLFDNSHIPEAISTRARQRWWRQGGGRFNLWYRDPLPEDAALWEPGWAPAPEDRVWVAMLGEEPVGYTALNGRGLSRLYLRPEQRHRRKGDQLLGQAVVRLREMGLEELQIGVPTANLEAVAFFARHCGNPVQMDDVYTVYHMGIRVN